MEYNNWFASQGEEWNNDEMNPDFSKLDISLDIDISQYATWDPTMQADYESLEYQSQPLERYSSSNGSSYAPSVAPVSPLTDWNMDLGSLPINIINNNNNHVNSNGNGNTGYLTPSPLIQPVSPMSCNGSFTPLQPLDSGFPPASPSSYDPYDPYDPFMMQLPENHPPSPHSMNDVMQYSLPDDFLRNHGNVTSEPRQAWSVPDGHMIPPLQKRTLAHSPSDMVEEISSTSPSSPTSMSQGYHTCPHCAKHAFRRRADLTRHIQHIHKPESLKTFPCDYSRCGRRKEPFRRRDHLRDHLREFHREDIEKRNVEVDQEWYDQRNVQPSWWRCNKCLVRIPVEKYRFECPKCKGTCCPKRQELRIQ